MTHSNRVAIAAVLLVAACQQRPEAPRGAPAPAPAARPEHDPASPPIDCPLRKAGVDPHGLRPFEDVEKYLAFLERPDRAAWQMPDAVVAALDLRGDELVADVGAGSGYFSFRLAEALPQGRVVALEIEPEMVRHIHHRAMSGGIGNVEVKLVAPDDPQIPAGVDLVFVCDVLHHVSNRAAWLGKISARMQPGSRLVLIEFREGELPEGPPAAVKIPKSEVMDLVEGAGLGLVEEKTGLLPYQYLLVFGKP